MFLMNWEYAHIKSLTKIHNKTSCYIICLMVCFHWKEFTYMLITTQCTQYESVNAIFEYLQNYDI